MCSLEKKVEEYNSTNKKEMKTIDDEIFNLHI